MKKALCVGINDYPGVDSDLNGCVNDCSDWADTLLTRGFGVTKLVNAEATKAAIVDQFSKLLTAVGPDDTAVFTFSGHGTWLPDIDGDEDDGRDEALCPYDLSETNLLLDDDILNIIHEYKKPKSRIVMIMDCCHSGTMIKAASLFNPGHVKVRYLPPTKFVKNPKLVEAMTVASSVPKVNSVPGGVLLAGCRDVEYSYDTSFGSRSNGAFTYFALEALKKSPVNYATWMKEVRKSLPTGKYPQTPQLQATSITRNWSVL